MIELFVNQLGYIRQHNYDEYTSIYTLHRKYGIFSNVMTALHGLAKVIELGYDPKKVVLKLAEYANDIDFYDLLFQQVDRPIDRLAATKIITELYPCTLGFARMGIGFNIEAMKDNLNGLNSIMTRYFAPSIVTKNVMSAITSRYNIDFGRTAFVWARRTDKSNEVDLPDVDDYVAVINKECAGYRILVQTDDLEIAERFSKSAEVCILQELPFCDNTNGFHAGLNEISDADFNKKYSISRFHYLTAVVALVYLAAKCSKFICYPGNLTSAVPILRNTFDGCYLFSDKSSLWS